MQSKVPLNKPRPKEQVMIRLAPELREKARQVAAGQSDDNVKYTETDVYRTAIEIFLSDNFTDSKVKGNAVS